MNFLSDDTGAVTVDWVVLTAGLVGLGLAVMTVVSSGVQDLSTDIDEELSTGSFIKTSFNLSPGTLGLGNSFISPGAPPQCENVGQDNQVCTQSTTTAQLVFMDDGSTWTRTTTTNTTSTLLETTAEQTILWEDGNGDVVAEDQWPDVPDDAENLSTHPMG